MIYKPVAESSSTVSTNVGVKIVNILITSFGEGLFVGFIVQA